MSSSVQLPETCPWHPEPEPAIGKACGKPATDAIVFEPDVRSVFPEPRIPVCAEHFAEVAAWVEANMGRVVGAGEPS